LRQQASCLQSSNMQTEPTWPSVYNSFSCLSAFLPTLSIANLPPFLVHPTVSQGFEDLPAINPGCVRQIQSWIPRRVFRLSSTLCMWRRRFSGLRTKTSHLTNSNGNGHTKLPSSTLSSVQRRPPIDSTST